MYGDPADKTVVIKGTQTHTISKHTSSVSTEYESINPSKVYYQIGQVVSINKNSGKHEVLILTPPYSPHSAFNSIPADSFPLNKEEYESETSNNGSDN